MRPELQQLATGSVHRSSRCYDSDWIIIIISCLSVSAWRVSEEHTDAVTWSNLTLWPSTSFIRRLINLSPLGSGGSSPQNLGHDPMASAVARAYNGGLGQSPQRGPGAELLVRGSGGEAPWSWSIFGFWTFNGSRKFAHVL